MHGENYNLDRTEVCRILSRINCINKKQQPKKKKIFPSKQCCSYLKNLSYYCVFEQQSKKYLVETCYSQVFYQHSGIITLINID